ncbi:outer membrane transport energization protein ExbB (TC 2.C.1.1.1) [Palleronia marisminoris]|uniref:Biopolymer transport protein ExbB n=1 Tax=Palleronia marisminoris TaxID=315423 RepID=A0A1Y5TS21_9RHOB|nr:MotA/TolQ/ExbB proton channel family protein [Palleronia marisminoris]SFH43553.1 outer membrane transport energization protein ExbB (TC 2.C.1.1.1) [Palleronia marisminoris]SLN66674.1 Biopolymer transport protein ExbB [Palleronia marisminoris]
MNMLLDPISRVADIGGPVVVLLMVIAVVTLAVVLYKFWQFTAAGVGRHRALRDAVAAWDRGDRTEARRSLDRSRSYLAPVVDMAVSAPPGPETLARLTAEAESRFAKLERGLRFLDMVAQLAPLIGLFGTVLGMIEAFQALQDAGAQVDPSILAGGIWVALLTTAVGLAVAMPTSAILSMFESRLDGERVLAERAISTIHAPMGGQSSDRVGTATPAHA